MCHGKAYVSVNLVHVKHGEGNQDRSEDPIEQFLTAIVGTHMRKNGKGVVEEVFAAVRSPGMCPSREAPCR